MSNRTRAQVPAEGNAVHTGHREVGDDHVGGLTVHESQGLQAVLGGEDVETGELESGCIECERIPVVIHNEHFRSRHWQIPGAPPPVFPRMAGEEQTSRPPDGARPAGPRPIRAASATLHPVHATPESTTRLSAMRRLLLGVPILLTIHNAEEVGGGMAALHPVALSRLPQWLRGAAGTPESWLLAVLLVTLVPWVIALLGDLRARDSAAVRALLVVQAGMTVNICSHVAGAVLLGRYSPGMVTALLLYVPFSFVLFRRAWREGWANRRLFAWLPAIALLLHGPGLIGLLALTSAVMR
ncbi:MAG: HXXEE domain-containing protein [Acidobacteria bacterium]|nr:MAG: HXXEE domain-containing protein [Acidobacteriota bacterium]